MDRSEIIVKNIRALLEERGLNVFQVAVDAGLGRTAIDDFLRRRSKSLKVETLEAIARQLDVSIHSLIDERSDDKLRQDLIDVVEGMDAADQERFLRIARAMRTVDN